MERAMMNEKLIAALDLGSGTVKFAIAEMDENGPVIIGFGSVLSKGVDRGAIVDLEKASESILKAKEQAENMSGKKVTTVIATVSGIHINSVNNKGTIIVSREGREITKEDVRRAEESAKVIMLQPNQEIIHVLPRQFIIDGQDGIRNPVGMAGIKFEEEVHIVTGSSTVLRNIKKSVRNAGLDVGEFVLQSFASSYSVLRDEEKELGVTLIDLGAGTADIISFAEGNIQFTEIFPMAGMYITRDLAYMLKIPLNQAEEIKKKYGFVRIEGDEEVEGEIEVKGISGNKNVTVSKKQIGDIITFRVEEILENIRFQLTKEGYWSNMNAGVVLTGGSANLKGIDKKAQEILEVPVRIGYPGDEGTSIGSIRKPENAAIVGLINYAKAKGSSGKRSFENWKDLSWLKDIFGF
jgi:cell division protein FtsA